jgi:hypothetical protein
MEFEQSDEAGAVSSLPSMFKLHPIIIREFLCSKIYQTSIIIDKPVKLSNENFAFMDCQ